MNEEHEKTAELFSAIGDVLLAGAGLARACEAGVHAWSDFQKTLEEKYPENDFTEGEILE